MTEAREDAIITKIICNAFKPDDEPKQRKPINAIEAAFRQAFAPLHRKAESSPKNRRKEV